MKNKFIWIGLTVILILAFLAWLFYASTRSLPGQKQDDLGRGHVPIGTEVQYNSNPPTSGAHYEEWTRAGIYSEPKDDRNLVHSLEHGYIIMSYNCKSAVSLIPQAFAHGIEEEASPSGDATGSGNLSSEFKSENCHKLVDQLIAIYERNGKRKLIIVPRPQLDAKIALTAWGYLEKFNPQSDSTLTEVEIRKIEEFINSHRDNGPERTME